MTFTHFCTKADSNSTQQSTLMMTLRSHTALLQVMRKNITGFGTARRKKHREERWCLLWIIPPTYSVMNCGRWTSHSATSSFSQRAKRSALSCPLPSDVTTANVTAAKASCAPPHAPHLRPTPTQPELSHSLLSSPQLPTSRFRCTGPCVLPLNHNE